MARHCQLTGKRANNAYRVSHSHRRTKRLQEVNLQWKRVWWPEGRKWVRLRLSTQALRTLQRRGLAALAREQGLNLHQL
ncbi:MAG: 50S ribosomal protein L28 [Gloeomargarita sp. SKYBB_i_bin120]|nr:50S ribosomal protein L28 [Gloeomargarita sp. SKYG98]MCS7292345.1 50S ribosomal protein L28 [Gloeomargarita sp. SKYB120]MDW8177905.1 50S ribosomal protein L28 [Gloeomargarita sp. SKYBB_i_bin120]